MALTALNEKIDALRTEAAAVRKAHRDLEDFVNSNASLSNEGKRAEITESHDRTRDKLNELKTRELDLIAAKRRTADEAINRTSGTQSFDIISFRDAADRAEKLDDQREAEKVMHRAITSKDSTLATAIMRRAVDKGWGDVYKAYAAEHSNVAEHIEDLALITEYEGSTQSAVDRWIYSISGN